MSVSRPAAESYNGMESSGSAGAADPAMRLLIVGTAMLTVVVCGIYAWSQGMRSYLPDEGIYTFVGWSWLQGDWPYRSTWDHKGPVIFFVTFLRTALLGTAPEMTAVQEITLGLATAALLAVAAKRLWGTAAACVVGFAGVLLWAQLGTTGGVMSTAGSIIAFLNACCILFAVLSLSAKGRTRILLLLALGFAGGLGFLAKPNAVGGLAAGALLIAWEDRRAGFGRLLRHALLVATGVLMPIALTAAVFAAAGDLSQMIEVAYLYNVRVRGPGVLSSLSPLALGVRVARGLRRLHVLVPVCITVLVTALASGERLFRGTTSRSFVGIELVAPLWLGLELLVYASNGVYGHHVYPVLFAVALCMGWIISIVLRLLPSDGRIWAIAIVIPLLMWPLGELARLRPVRDGNRDWRHVAERIRDATSPDERVLVFARMWGPAVLTLAERRTAVRYIHSPGLHALGYASDERWGEVTSVLERTDAPRFIVLHRLNLGDPPPDGPDPAWLVTGIDLEEAAGPFTDHTAYPNRERAKALIVQRYDVDYCEGALCILKLARPTDPTGA